MKEFDIGKYYEELVPVMITDDDGNDLVVTLNGINYVMKKGQTIELPRKIAMIIEESLLQKQKAKSYLESLKAK